MMCVWASSHNNANGNTKIRKSRGSKITGRSCVGLSDFQTLQTTHNSQEQNSVSTLQHALKPSTDIKHRNEEMQRQKRNTVSARQRTSSFHLDLKLPQQRHQIGSDEGWAGRQAGRQAGWQAGRQAALSEPETNQMPEPQQSLRARQSCNQHFLSPQSASVTMGDDGGFQFSVFRGC